MAVSDAPDVQVDATAAVFDLPEPIDVPVEPVMDVDELLHQAMFASEPPFQLFGAASKYSPLELPLVEGVMKMIPPPGPISPTAHALEHGCAGVTAPVRDATAPVPPEFTAATLK
jgi:hypothetical protein